MCTPLGATTTRMNGGNYLQGNSKMGRNIHLLPTVCGRSVRLCMVAAAAEFCCWGPRRLCTQAQKNAAQAERTEKHGESTTIEVPPPLPSPPRKAERAVHAIASVQPGKASGCSCTVEAHVLLLPPRPVPSGGLIVAGATQGAASAGGSRN